MSGHLRQRLRQRDQQIATLARMTREALDVGTPDALERCVRIIATSLALDEIQSPYAENEPCDERS